MSIIMYHYVRDLKCSRYPDIKGLDIKEFIKQIDYLSNNYNIITMEELIASKYEGYNLPHNAALLTFDDGYVDHYTNVFPILYNRGIQGSFFPVANAVYKNILIDVNKIHFILASTSTENIIKEIFSRLDYYRAKGFNIKSDIELLKCIDKTTRFDNSEIIFIKRLLQFELEEDLRNMISSHLFNKFVGIAEDVFAKELYMNEKQIKCMKKSGMYFGIHGTNHYWLGKTETDVMKKDIEDSLSYFSDIIDRNNWVINYPFGSYNDEVVSYVNSNNCKLGLTTNVGIANIKKDNPFTLKRLDTNDIPPKSDNYLKFLK